TLTLYILKALDLSAPPPADRPGEGAVRRLDARLHLGPQVLGRVLRGLEQEGLVRGGPGEAWAVTALGREALGRGEYPRPRRRGRMFHFVAVPDREGAPGREPQFLALHNSSGIAWPPAAGARFDVRALAACLGRPPEWKQRHGFPLDVLEILGLPPEG